MPAVVALIRDAAGPPAPRGGPPRAGGGGVVTGQWASTVPVDADGTPVGDCVMWMDTRGGRHARQRCRRPVSGYSPLAVGHAGSAAPGAPRRPAGPTPSGTCCSSGADRPGRGPPARWYLEPVDYLSMRFTGVAAGVATPR